MIVGAIWITIFIVLLLKFKNRRKVALLNKLPGPKGVPILGNAFQFVGIKREDRMKELMRRDIEYGPMYRAWVGPYPYVHISNAEYAEILLSLKNTKKGRFYTFLEPWLGRGVLTADGEHWVRQRKFLTPTFHFQVLESFLDTFADCARTLISILRKKAETGEPISIHPLMTLTTLDFLCETAMGTKINAQINSDSEYVRAVCDLLALMYYRYDRIWLHSDFIWHLTKAGKEEKKKIKIAQDLVDKVIRERREARQKEKATPESKTGENDVLGLKKKKAFLDLVLDENDKQEDALSDVELRDEVNTIMFGGHDSTTAAICYVLFMLGSRPSVQEKVYQEQMTIIGSSKDKAPTIHNLNDMNFLERVIKETLRMHPPIPIIGRTLTEDTKFGEHIIPEGTVIVLNIVTILRDPKHFENPDEFNPDRYLPENASKRHFYAHIPFSAGQRNCLGQRYAMTEIKTIISLITRNFKIETVTKPEELVTVIEIVQKPLNPLLIKLHPRQ